VCSICVDVAIPDQSTASKQGGGSRALIQQALAEQQQQDEGVFASNNNNNAGNDLDDAGNDEFSRPSKSNADGDERYCTVLNQTISMILLCTTGSKIRLRICL
jgi:E3 ubiquitin-protein ligase DOA10